ncbi:MAG TPA: glycosyltransferase [Candidatus Bathyarchaeia archaeon]|nr:glycosyltransferase [Candidatus Bathyarchaeia archaeon]
MKIAYVSTYLPQQCGIATYTNYVIRAIQTVSPLVDVKVVAEKGASPVKREKFEVVPCWDRNENYVEPIISNILDADIVHIQHEYGIYGLDDRLPTLLTRLKAERKRTIITIHCITPLQFSHGGVMTGAENCVKRLAELADEVIVHLDPQKAILERLSIPLEKIHVITHGTALSDADKKDSRRRLQLPEEGKIITVFGFISPFKGLDLSLEVLNEIREEVEDAYLFIAGGLPPTASEKERKYVQLLKETIKKNKLTGNVLFSNNFIPNEEVPYVFGASDVVLYPHYHEDRSASGSVHLAIGAKKPVIAYRVPKFEVVKNISDELLILPGNVSGIAKTAIRLFTDKEFERYVLDRTERYRRATSWPVTVRKHLRLYLGVD